jgi:hypothetical protein
MQNKRGRGKKKKAQARSRKVSFHQHFFVNSTQQSPSSEVNSSSASHKIPHILQNLKVHDCIQKNMPLVPIMSHNNTVHALPANLRPILILSSHPCLGILNSIFASGFPTKTLYVLLFCPIHVTFPPSHPL